MNLNTLININKKKFDLKFKKLLNNKLDTSILSKAMYYGSINGGKRIRPFLVMESAKIAKISSNDAFVIASSIECIHSYSLIHDDLPSMDNDDYRRGKLTVHKKFDEATAVLAGDMFQVLSVKTLVESKHLSPSQKVEAIQMLSKANGLEGLIAGQSLDIYMNKKTSIKDIEVMYSLKTGALFSLCFILLLIVKKLNVQKRKELKLIGDTIGKIFQVTDDMLDRWGDEKKVGKKINKDSKKANIAYKYNYKDSLKYLYHIQDKNYRSLKKFFSNNQQGLVYISSLVDFISNRVK